MYAIFEMGRRIDSGSFLIKLKIRENSLFSKKGVSMETVEKTWYEIMVMK